MPPRLSPWKKRRHLAISIPNKPLWILILLISYRQTSVCLCVCCGAGGVGETEGRACFPELNTASLIPSCFQGLRCQRSPSVLFSCSAPLILLLRKIFLLLTAAYRRELQASHELFHLVELFHFFAFRSKVFPLYLVSFGYRTSSVRLNAWLALPTPTHRFTCKLGAIGSLGSS